MSSAHDKYPPLDDQELDLLVDGELSGEKRRELLEKLEAAPSGWRRCALAFLESQAWKGDLGAIRRAGAGAVKETEAVKEAVKGTVPFSSNENWDSPPCENWDSPLHENGDSPPRENWDIPLRDSRGSPRAWPWGTLLAMSASFLLALGLGAYVRGLRWPATVAPEPGEVARAGAPPKAVETPSPASASVATDNSPWQTITVPVSVGPEGATETVRLPARVADHLDPQWLEHVPSVMPREVLEALEQSGHQVEQQRRLVPVRLQDGRQLVVPVDQVEVRYVGKPAF